MLMKQTRQAVRAFKQSKLLRCLWGNGSGQNDDVCLRNLQKFSTKKCSFLGTMISVTTKRIYPIFDEAPKEPSKV